MSPPTNMNNTPRRLYLRPYGDTLTPKQVPIRPYRLQVIEIVTRRGGRVAEGGGLLNLSRHLASVSERGEMRRSGRREMQQGAVRYARMATGCPRK